MSENMNWGKGKGCDFVQNACLSNQTYSEFPKDS